MHQLYVTEVRYFFSGVYFYFTRKQHNTSETTVVEKGSVPRRYLAWNKSGTYIMVAELNLYCLLEKKEEKNAVRKYCDARDHLRLKPS